MNGKEADNRASADVVTYPWDIRDRDVFEKVQPLWWEQFESAAHAKVPRQSSAEARDVLGPVAGKEACATGSPFSLAGGAVCSVEKEPVASEDGQAGVVKYSGLVTYPWDPSVAISRDRDVVDEDKNLLVCQKQFNIAVQTKVACQSPAVAWDVLEPTAEKGTCALVSSFSPIDDAVCGAEKETIASEDGQFAVVRPGDLITYPWDAPALISSDRKVIEKVQPLYCKHLDTAAKEKAAGQSAPGARDVLVPIARKVFVHSALPAPSLMAQYDA